VPGPVNVLTLIDHLQLQGGAERVAVDIATRLDQDRFAPLFCLTRWAPEWREELDEEGLEALRAAGIPLMWVRRRTKLDLISWRPILATLRRRPVHVLHSHKIGSNVWGSVLGSLAGVPVVVAHEHTWSFEGQPHRRLLDRYVVAPGADAIVAVSEADRERMIEIERIPPERIRYIPNGIVPLPAGDGAGVRAELGIPADAPLVGAVGALRPQKAFPVLVDAAVRLREQVPGIRVVIAGGGPQETLLGYIAEAGAGDVVSLLGPRTDIPDVLAALDVFVNSSDFEGQPIAILEAMEAALPVVATSVGGVPDLIQDGLHGRLVPRRDAEALAGAIRGLLADRDAARAMGERARARRRSEFDLGVTVRQVEQLYDELLDSRRATA
jgi:glycosyltransferase involved in cell wall biosynthesis